MNMREVEKGKEMNQRWQREVRPGKVISGDIISSC